MLPLDIGIDIDINIDISNGIDNDIAIAINIGIGRWPESRIVNFLIWLFFMNSFNYFNYSSGSVAFCSPDNWIPLYFLRKTNNWHNNQLYWQSRILAHGHGHGHVNVNVDYDSNCLFS